MGKIYFSVVIGESEAKCFGRRQQSPDDMKISHYHAGQRCAGPYRRIITMTSYAERDDAIELYSSDLLLCAAHSIWCALPDLIFLIQLWTLSSGKSARAHKRSRLTVEPRLLFHNRCNETTASRESCANRASAVNRGGDVESYVWIKVILLDMPQRMGWGREGWYAKYFMNEILLGPQRFCHPWESSNDSSTCTYIGDAKRIDSRCIYMLLIVAFCSKCHPELRFNIKGKTPSWPGQKRLAFLQFFSDVFSFRVCSPCSHSEHTLCIMSANGGLAFASLPRWLKRV